MPRCNRPDPYNGFKSDLERRRALNTKVRWNAVKWMIVAGAPSMMKGLSWLATLFR